MDFFDRGNNPFGSSTSPFGSSPDGDLNAQIESMIKMQEEISVRRLACIRSIFHQTVKEYAEKYNENGEVDQAALDHGQRIIEIGFGSGR